MARQSNSEGLVRTMDMMMSHYVVCSSSVKAAVQHTLVNGIVPLHVIDMRRWTENSVLAVNRTELPVLDSERRVEVAERLNKILLSDRDSYDNMIMTAQVLWRLLFPVLHQPPVDPHVVTMGSDYITQLSESYIRHRYGHLMNWLSAVQQAHILRYLQHLYFCATPSTAIITRCLLMTAIDTD